MKLIDFYTKQTRTFNDETLNVYVCGPTVYNDAHIGNVRPIIIFDILSKITNMNLVHNITDIDDKIIAKAKELNIAEKEVSAKYENAYLKLLKDLNIEIPNKMPKVTENIEGMIEFIDELITKGHAYESNGSVYFEVNSYEKYGLFADIQLDTLINEGVSEDKKHSKDFALWKATTDGIQFDSKWGKGRPGWHTECSYFIKLFFDEKGIDIHGGGIDLKFPHHVNEMAQYDSYYERESDNLWLYVGHITMDNKKMSKSLGNVIYAKDFIKDYGYDVLRHLILSVNYLKPLNVNEDTIKNSISTINKIKNSIIKVLMNYPQEVEIKQEIRQESLEHLKNNLDTPSIFTGIFKLVDKLNNTEISSERKEALKQLLGDLSLIGIEYKFNFDSKSIVKAKEEKDYETLDKIREGIIIC